MEFLFSLVFGELSQEKNPHRDHQARDLKSDQRISKILIWPQGGANDQFRVADVELSSVTTTDSRSLAQNPYAIED